MSISVLLLANTLSYPQGGGHLWAYLNWALGLRALGCDVIWLEAISPKTPAYEVQACVAALKSRLERYELAERMVFCSRTGEPLPRGAADGCASIEEAGEVDLFLNLAYAMPPEVVGRFRRSALVDIDPGLTQIWMNAGLVSVARHDVYFTIGETVGHPEALFPDCGLPWRYTPPPVFLPAWPPTPADSTAPYTTVTHWWGSLMEYRGESYYNGKRDGFLPYLDLPHRTTAPLELVVCLGANEDDERTMLGARGWRLRDPQAIVSTPWDYRRYIQGSRGEFSCAKPSCTHLQNAWISDRTLCYLASGKPAVVQHTGPSRFLPDAEGLFRFRDPEEAVRCLSIAEQDYDRHSRAAVALAGEYFDSEKILSRLLDQALR